jgi:K+-transporting ATPase KdpF subunit
MRKTLAIIGGAVAVLLAAVLLYAATKPDTFRVQRAASIKAPPEKISAVLSDFHAWEAWSPWEKLDPAMKRGYSGAAKGKGAVYAWQGNSEVGQGRMEITEAAPSRVAMDLDFVKPFEAHNKVVFTLVPKGDSTEVTWTMQGPLPYMAKVAHVVFDMDSMVGKQFETGLANLKSISEK